MYRQQNRIFYRLHSNLLWMIAGLLVFVSEASGAMSPELRHAQSTKLIAGLVSNYHYSLPEVDDRLSSSTLDRYIRALDPNRQIFLAGDVQSFEVYRYQLDEAMTESNASSAFNIYNVFLLRLVARINFALEMLETKHNFSVDESFRIDYEDVPWVSTEKELDELWRKRVKNDILQLKLAGKKQDKITETLRKRYEGVLRRARQQKAGDVYELFMNAFTASIDPHTTYYSPHNFENFNINMSLSLEGIGAALRSKNEHTVVQKVIAGGPADLSGQLHPKDKIIGVAQDQKEMVDVIGWRLKDVVQLIRGPKGSVVRLLLQPYTAGEDGPSREITLVRDKIKLEEQAAQSSVIKDLPGNPGVNIGVIDIPTFYMDFDARARGDDDYRSTTRDVRKLVQDLKRQKVDGIVIDLRGNGGGSLTEATEMTGLFIKSGPVVQVKGTRGNIDINRDSDPEILYDGPMVVLVDRYSASASEIFAGAMQDYGRALVVGEPTFGKGTVQTMIDLNRYRTGKEDLGQLKVTIAQFFRVNGSSTQHRGVRPDIVYPTVLDISDQGERSLDNALPWARVAAADYEPSGNPWFNLDVLRNRDKSRIAKDPGFTYLVNIAKQIKDVRDKKFVSLLESKRRSDREARRKRSLELENEFRQSRGLKLLTLKDKDRDDDLEDLEDEEEENPVAKIQLYEAAHILADHINLVSGRLAASGKGKS